MATGAPEFREVAWRACVHILDKIYETGRKYAADFKEIMPIVFDTHLPKWNYRAIPQE
ncbi:hypothetical protein [Bathymodiolus platifrons methanotrophic gill symbiont]|uniref:hypothetical protein n=1 Tax=Bathymodiolus platifrons methanotrophic gill symbiont TaxID=113268 RepID=UPI001C8DF924|nr:hypothetical protein [Bathymodiolus platifrons methanotrophic gill symbiont]